MSSLQQMQIMGVRSFGPKPETIKFNTPLTLIVGWNGSGKTTIIECLKYATTGELPANSKTSGSFIHDPSLRGDKEMLAQIKLAFKSTSGVAMVATRSLQVTVNKTSRSQKTLDGCLEMRKDGVKETVSSRVAQLDAAIPQYLGVSKAILENVIFCHQDESLWPISTPAELKKKFDAIFEAEKYMKAIANLKDIRKVQQGKLLVLQNEEKHLKNARERGIKSEKDQAALWDKMEELRKEYEQTDEDWLEAKEKMTKAFNKAAKFEQIISQLNGKRVAYNTNEENVSSLEDNLKMMAESDQELDDMLAQYAERVQQYVDQQTDLKTTYRQFQEELQRNRNGLGAKQGDIGKLEAEKDHHERNMQKRESLVIETAKRHKIRGFEYDLDDTQIAEFIQALAKLSREQNRSLDRAREELQKSLQGAQAELSRLGEEKSKHASRKETAKTQITSNDRRVSELQNQMNRIKADEGAEAILKSSKAEAEQQLRLANASAEMARWDEKIHEAEKTVHGVDEDTERLQTELIEATNSARESARLDGAMEDLKKARDSLETMTNVHSARIAQLVDVDWDVTTLADTFDHVKSEKADKVKQANARSADCQRELASVNFKLSSVEADLKKKRNDYRKWEKMVLDAIGRDHIDDFNDRLRDLEEEYEITSANQAKFEAQMEYMRECLKTAREDNVCRLCTRTLKDDKADHFSTTAFLAKLENYVAKATKNAREEDADKIFEELDAVRNVQPKYEQAHLLRETEIPAAEAEQKKLVKERDEINMQLEKIDGIVYDCQATEQEIMSLSADVDSIVMYHDKVQELESTIDDLKKKQKVEGRSRGIQAVRDDLQKISEQSRTAKATLTSLSNEREASRKLINSLEFRTRDISAELSAAQASLKEKRALAGRIEEIKATNTTERANIRQADEGIEALIPQINEANVKYNDVNRRGTERVHQIQDEVSKVDDSVRQLNNIGQEIEAYINKGGPDLLARARQQMERFHGEIQRCEEEMADTARQVKQIEQKASNTEQTKQSIFDNIRYRRAKRALETLGSEISDLEAQNAEKDQEHWNGEGFHWDAESQRLNALRIELSTTLKEKDLQLTEMGKEYKQEYENAAQKYRETHIMVETTKAACSDITRYRAALDQAIMKYHAVKMEQINKTIDELWRNAYQGTDVDTIQILTDNETGRGNQTYNYRVVMFKSGSPMDMRGRCSAGQKVLASIVIRLALAECFGTNCGLIALDEPTTNLDQQNIKGLAESLSQIIQVRKKQANFQLLVITHDEQFLRDMNCADHTDVYWRVGRDANQESFIERQNISEVS